LGIRDRGAIVVRETAALGPRRLINGRCREIDTARHDGPDERIDPTIDGHESIHTVKPNGNKCVARAVEGRPLHVFSWRDRVQRLRPPVDNPRWSDNSISNA